MSIDKLICEEITQHIKNQIPSIARNIHEAFGEGFGRRAGLFAREMGQRVLTGLHKEALRTQAEIGQSVLQNHVNLRNAHLQKIGVNPKEYERAMSYSPIPRVPPPPNASSAAIAIHNGQMEAYNDRINMEQKVARHSLTNPGLAKSLSAIDAHKRFFERIESTQLSRIDPTGTRTPAARAEALRNARLSLKKQRRDAIPAEYGSYKAVKPADPNVAGSRNLLARVQAAYQPATPAIIRSPSGHFLPSGSRIPARPAVPARYGLTRIGQLLQGIETII